jgi:hypothetical protein
LPQNFHGGGSIATLEIVQRPLIAPIGNKVAGGYEEWLRGHETLICDHNSNAIIPC